LQRKEGYNLELCRGLGLGYGSRVMRVTGQLNDGSRGCASWVKNCDPLSDLATIRTLQTDRWDGHDTV